MPVNSESSMGPPEVTGGLRLPWKCSKLSLGFRKRCTESQLLHNLSRLTCGYPPSAS